MRGTAKMLTTTTSKFPAYTYYRPKPLVREHKVKRDIDIQDLFAMHSVNRAPGGVFMEKWRKRWLEGLPGAFYDTHDNLIVAVDLEKTTTIFTSHTDTVGRDSYSSIYARNGIIRNRGGVLGADDTVGCWIMRRMIKAGVPGLYVFHDGEETGCTGSRLFVEENAGLLRVIDRVISFDRMGYSDVITNQSGTDCCSDAFALELSERLNALNTDFKYKPSALGAFTDSAQYMYDVPECTNISVGYFGQHGAGECLDMYHAYDLMMACIKLDWESLPTVRDPNEAHNWRKYVSKKYLDANKLDDELWIDEHYGEYENLTTSSSSGVKQYHEDDLLEFENEAMRCDSASEFIQLFYMNEDRAVAWISWRENMRWPDVEVVYGARKTTK